MHSFEEFLVAIQSGKRLIGLKLDDQVTLAANNLNPRIIRPKRIARIGPLVGLAKAFVCYLTDNEEEVLYVFHNDGHQLCLLLKQIPDVPIGNRRQLVDQGGEFLFEDTSTDPPIGWNFFKDLTLGGATFDRQTPNEAPEKCIETPLNAARGSNLVASVAIYFSASEAVNHIDKGNFIALIEIGDASSADGGLIRLYQGREIPFDDLELE